MPPLPTITRFHQDAVDIRTRFKAAFTDLNTSIRVILEAQPEDTGGSNPFPTVDSEFVYMKIRQNDSRQVSLNRNRDFRHYGIVSVFIQTKLGQGTKRDEEIADLVGRALGAISLGAVVMRDPHHTQFGSADGRWFRSAVTTRYQSTFQEI